MTYILCHYCPIQHPFIPQQYYILMSQYPSKYTTVSAPVLEILRNQFMKYQGTPFCFVQTSHRSKAYDNLNTLTVDLIRKYLNADNYQILLMPSGSAMPALFFNVYEEASSVLFYSKGSFSERYYEQIKKYIPKTHKATDQLQLISQLENEKKNKGRNIIHYNKIDDGLEVTLPIIPHDIKQNCIIVRNINYCFPWRQTQPLNQHIVYFQTQTGFSIPGFTVILVRKQLIAKLKVRQRCPDMFDFLMMVKMKSVVNTPFTLCTLVLYQNIKYGLQNADLIYKNILNNKKLYTKLLGNQYLTYESDEVEVQMNEAYNFMRVPCKGRNEQFLRKFYPYGWTDKQNQVFYFYIQNQKLSEQQNQNLFVSQQ